MDNRLISGTLPQTVRALHIKPEGRFTNRPYDLCVMKTLKHPTPDAPPPRS